MKTLSLLIIAILLFSCKPNEEYTISGTFTFEPEEEWIYLVKVFTKDGPLDSARIIDRKFSFSGITKQPEICAISYHMRSSTGVLTFILEPSDLDIKITPEWYNDYKKVQGGKYNTVYNEFGMKKSKLFYEPATILRNQLKTAEKEKKMTITSKLKRLEKEGNIFTMDYIRKNTESPVSMYLLMWKYNSLEDAELGELLTNLSSLKDMTVYKKIKSDYENQMALANRTPVINKNDSASYYEIQLDSSSVIQSLVKNNPNKVLYIDTWSTTCPPCLREFPYSRILQDKFIGKEIIFIYLCIGTNNESEWKEHVTKHKLSGQHYLLNKKLTETYFTEMDGNRLRSIPQYAIVNKKGEIVYKNAPEPSSKVIESMLQELLN